MSHRLALVTGATGGLGGALCHLLAAQHISLIIVGRDASKLEELSAQLSNKISVTPCAADFSNPEERQRVVTLIHAMAPDLVINNAGFGLYGEALLHATEEHLDLLEVNCKALVEFSLEAARALLNSNKKGTILNISSAAGFFVYPAFATYAASKAFVTQFSLALDDELSPYGVRVLTTCPGQINTSFRSKAAKGIPQKKDSFTLSYEKAAALIYQQIKKKRRLCIIDWRYHLSVFFGRFLVPKRLLRKSLCRVIEKRINK